MSIRPRRTATAVASAIVLVGSLLATPAEAHRPPPSPGSRDRAVGYILPPGNYGGLPTTPQSTDQLPLYAALTPLRGT